MRSQQQIRTNLSKGLKSKLAHVASISKDSKENKRAKIAKHLPKDSVNESSTQSFEDVRLQKTCKCARPLTARICFNDDLKNISARDKSEGGENYNKCQLETTTDKRTREFEKSDYIY